MDPPEMKLKVLVMPVFKKKWMYHAWEIKPSSGPSLTQQHVENPSLPQRLTALGHTISDKVSMNILEARHLRVPRSEQRNLPAAGLVQELTVGWVRALTLRSEPSTTSDM